jgi:histidinol-phosphatase
MEIKFKLENCSSISEATLTYHRSSQTLRNIKIKMDLKILLQKAKLYRNWGDCYGYYLIATGFADIMIDPIMSVWDSMALFQL